MSKPRRNALNRGSCVYLEGARVRFLWACGCKRVETIKDVRGGAVPPEQVRKLSTYWRRNGVILPQCRRHLDWHDRANQVPRLNSENPQQGEAPL